MNEQRVTINTGETSVSVLQKSTHTLVIGSGAAGLNAAVQLQDNGIEDIIIVSEGLTCGTSINTGSDKQTYYKLALCGEDVDSPMTMAKNYFAGGSMHGDLALVEASVSARAFLNLVNLGVPFPQDKFGQFVGYKTDHDPRQRATSIGPYTSKQMCLSLIDEIKRKNIAIDEKTNVVELIVIEENGDKRVAGAVALDSEGKFVLYKAENVVFATGGPGGLYKTSAYPNIHTGAIGLALLAGAKAQSLPESQFGLASTKFRWNVSGTYMQVIPKFISTDQDGNDETEFLREYFDNLGEMNSMVFLKGYQWPFDTKKVIGGSSIVDILVYIETVIRGRRVWLDFRDNPVDFEFSTMSDEAREYLENSSAAFGRPIDRLQKMNPGAISLYSDHGIDITSEMLEIAVCAQHNNGGLAANHWWESLNIKHLFPIGEVNGSHGVARPGGSALNSGQVAGFRAAEFIANRYKNSTLTDDTYLAACTEVLTRVCNFSKSCSKSNARWQDEREKLQSRMSRAGAHIRKSDDISTAIAEARKQWERLSTNGCSFDTASGKAEAFRNRQLCFAHLVYLEAILFAVESGAGSRGSAMVLSPSGNKAHDKLGEEWNFVAEDDSFREKVLETLPSADGSVNQWVDRRPIPESNLWFETAWADYRAGKIYE